MLRRFCLPVFLLLSFVAAFAHDTAVYRINAGGSAFTDSAGHVWSADSNFNTGSTYSVTNAIAGSVDDKLFQTERYDPTTSPELQYSLPVANGKYTVKLSFAENYSGAQAVGKRVFDVYIEGQLVYDNLDIYQLAGGYTALILSKEVTVSDGTLNISFGHVVENPKINAIEVLANEPPTAVASASPSTGPAPLTVNLKGSDSTDADGTIASYSWDFGDGQTGNTADVTHIYQNPGTYVATLTVTDDDGATASQAVQVNVTTATSTVALYRINAGGSAYTDSNGNAWSADTKYNTGSTYTTTAAIAGTVDDKLFQTERWDPATSPELQYSLPVANGTYTVNLGFAENFAANQAVGKRVFNIYMEGQPAFENFDIFQQAGANTALIVSKDVSVTDGTLNISFGHLVENPKINTIEVLGNSTTPPPNQAPTAVATGSPTSGVAPLTVNFNGSASSDPDGTIASYAWNFGDGQTATTANPSHVYQNAGNYTATLTVTDKGGLTASATVPVTVSGAPTTLYRINAGGTAYTDSLGQVWSADQYYNTGATFSTTAAINGTVDDKLYQTERYDNSTAPVLQYSLPVPNGTYTVKLHFAEVFTGAQAVGKRVFDILLEGIVAQKNFDIFAEAGGYNALVKQYEVTVSDGTLNIQFAHVVENPKINAIEVLTAGSGSHDMHAVIVVDPYTVDYDGNGSENVFLKGSDSHTHEVGKSIVGYQWSENGTVFSTSADLTRSFALGSHTVQLKITDNSTPAKTDTATATFIVAAKNNVPGALALYYGSTSPGSLLDSVPATASYGQVRSTFNIPLENATVGGTPYTNNVMVRLFGSVNITTAGQYTFQAAGGSDRRLFVDGALASGAISLGTGKHTVEARFSVTDTTQLPLVLTYALNSAAQGPIDPPLITHDETNLKPVINTAPNSGAAAGGEQVVITGLGFFPAASTVVHWGTQNLSGASLQVTPTSITLVSPLGTGTINVTVETPNGVSDTSAYTYTSTSAVNFGYSVLTTMNAPTQADWGPDGRLYVGSLDGTINAYTFDDNYIVTNVQTISTIAGLTNNNILGLTFNPHDPPGAVKIYVAHGLIYAEGGGCFTGPAPYTGQVSVLTGPSFSTVQPLITNLPVSNHDHAINGMQFDNNGDLLIAVGGNTNAGVQDCAMGDIPESPFSAAILRAKTSKGSAFNGSINYVNSGTNTINNDQVSGGSVDVKSGVDVQVFAQGFRNPWDLVYTTKGIVFNTDNGPNSGFGPTSTSATTQTTDASDSDELNLTEYGNYYGHPNRNRGRYDVRQNVYRGGSGSGIAGIFSQKLATFQASTNGITEYRANTFGGALRGNLFTQKWNSTTYKIVLGQDGKSVTSSASFTSSLATLDIVAGPGGVLIGTDYSNNKLKIAKPNDTTALMTVFDIFPWRAPKAGGKSFVIGGKNFGGATTVKIGGVTATITSVTPTRIKGTIPAFTNAPSSLLDLVVTSNGQTSTLTQAFRYLSAPGSEPIPDRWVSGSPLPASIGEVAGGVIGTKLYLVGENSSATLSYDLADGTWSSTTALAQRPFIGNHHGAEVYNGKLYLIGGFGGGSEGKVQIYNPATNSWSQGASVPFATGSAATALINGQIYVAGGIVNGTTTNLAAKYNPATNTWTSIAPMPVGRNHAASNTDGTKLYVFGGRGAGSGDGNVVANGYNDTQIYNSATNTWQSSSQSGSTLAPLPQARGGTGKAVYYKGEFYVIGGETSTGAGATAQKVYTRVDIYNPVTNTWRRGAEMPTGRHGIFPLLHGWHIYVGGGGTQAGFSNSNINQIYIP